MSDEIPRRSVQRSARLASLPLGFASRTAAGWGRRLAGGDQGTISADVARRGAEQLFEVLGELKGGAMKVGQALSVFEAGMPEKYAGPFREALTKLQAEAPPMPPEEVEHVLDAQLGLRWRERFSEFDGTATAAARPDLRARNRLTAAVATVGRSHGDAPRARRTPPPIAEPGPVGPGCRARGSPPRGPRRPRGSGWRGDAAGRRTRVQR